MSPLVCERPARTMSIDDVLSLRRRARYLDDVLDTCSVSWETERTSHRIRVPHAVALDVVRALASMPATRTVRASLCDDPWTPTAVAIVLAQR